MDLYKHKSGAQKQKDKEKKHEKEKKGQQTLFHVGVKSKNPESVLEAKFVSALYTKIKMILNLLFRRRLIIIYLLK